MLQEHYGAGFDLAGFRGHFSTSVQRQMSECVPVKPGVVELLDHFRERGLPLAIATSAGRATAERNLGRAGLLDRFDALATRDDVEHPLFPEVREMDEARTSSVAQTEEWLGLAGFREVFSREVVQQTYPDGPAHLEAARNKSTSVLTLISEESYQTGLRRLEECVRRQPDNEWLLFNRMTLTVGRT